MIPISDGCCIPGDLPLTPRRGGAVPRDNSATEDRGGGDSGETLNPTSCIVERTVAATFCSTCALTSHSLNSYAQKRFHYAV